MFDDVSSTDVHACHSLVAECRDLGADVDAWRLHLIETLRSLVGARVIIATEMEHFGVHSEDEETRALGRHRVGWESDRAEEIWREYASSTPTERTPEFPYLSKYSGDAMLLGRDEIWGKENWYRSRTYNEIHRVCGIDDYIISLSPIPVEGRCMTLWLHRGVGDGGFSDRERAIVGIMHQAVTREIGTYLAAADEPRLASLTLRRVQVLDRLLYGDSEKQIAFAMDLSKATVHEHVLAVYRHFGVSSRGELLARFIGRARPRLDRN